MWTLPHGIRIEPPWVAAARKQDFLGFLLVATSLQRCEPSLTQIDCNKNRDADCYRLENLSQILREWKSNLKWLPLKLTFILLRFDSQI